MLLQSGYVRCGGGGKVIIVTPRSKQTLTDHMDVAFVAMIHSCVKRITRYGFLCMMSLMALYKREGARRILACTRIDRFLVTLVKYVEESFPMTHSRVSPPNR